MWEIDWCKKSVVIIRSQTLTASLIKCFRALRSFFWSLDIFSSWLPCFDLIHELVIYWLLLYRFRGLRIDISEMLVFWIFRLVNIIQQEKLILIDDFLAKTYKKFVPRFPEGRHSRPRRWRKFASCLSFLKSKFPRKERRSRPRPLYAVTP
jgi:hypothetical protein